MRFWKGILTITVMAVIVSLTHSFYLKLESQIDVSAGVGERFITISDKSKNEKLVALRKQCGNMTSAIQELRPRIGDDDGEEAAISYQELVADVVDSLMFDGVIPAGCVLSTEEGWFIMFSTKGDMFIGLNGRAITTYSEQLRQEGNEVAETRSVWNKMRSIVESRG